MTLDETLRPNNELSCPTEAANVERGCGGINWDNEVSMCGSWFGLCGMDDDIIAGEMDANGVVKPNILNAPYSPSRQERMEHEVTHLPYRSWCDHCVRGKSKSRGHYASSDEESKIPVIGFDYAFLSKESAAEDGTDEVKTLVAKDKKSKCVFAIPVPQKGVDPEDYAIRQILKLLQWLGHSEVILQSDQEPAILKVLEGVQSHRGAGTRTAIQKSPVGDSMSNGLVERANQSVEGQVRTMTDAIESKTGVKLDATLNIFPWLIQHAGLLINRFHVTSDGKTGHERVRGRKSRKELVEFGECVHWMPLKDESAGSIDPRWLDGVWLGVRMESDEVLIWTSEGIFPARSIQRKPAEHRWDVEQIKSVKGTPWKPYGFTDDDRLRSQLPANPNGERSIVERTIVEDPAPRRMRIERNDLERIGYTPGCPGCYNARQAQLTSSTQ